MPSDFERQFKIERHLARMHAAEEMFPAILDPFDRPIEARGGKRNQNVLGINVALDAETAADVRQDASDTPFFHAEHGCG